jgi:quinol monooxygenase YgiN
MATVIIHHDVKDYDSWRQVFDAVEGKRRAGGEQAIDVYRDSANPNAVSAVATYDSLENAQAWFANDELKAAMAEAGVVGKPQIRYVSNA